MVDQSEYWKRVEKAARRYIEWRHLLLLMVALECTVLQGDLRKCVLEMEEKPDEQAK